MFHKNNLKLTKFGPKPKAWDYLTAIGSKLKPKFCLIKKDNKHDLTHIWNIKQKSHKSSDKIRDKLINTENRKLLDHREGIRVMTKKVKSIK